MSLLSDCFASYVNLDHRPDRRERMEKTLEAVGISAVRQRGMLPEEYKGDELRVMKMKNRTPGAIGCHFSQVTVMNIAASQHKHAFVMEDDLIFCDDFMARLELMESFLRWHPWDILWLGAMFHVNPPHWHKERDAELTSYPRMLRTFGAFSTHAYIVNASSILKVLGLLELELPNSIGIDYAMIQMQPRLLTYAFVPGSVIQYDNKSDIGKGMTMYSQFSKLGPYWFQKKMGEFNPLTFDWKEAKPC